MKTQHNRYRVMGFYQSTPQNEETLNREHTSKCIAQCDTLDAALREVKTLFEQHPECTMFQIERGQWL